MGLLFLLGRQRTQPHRIAVLSGVDDRWTQIVTAVTVRERDHRELTDDMTVTSVGTGHADDSNAWLSSGGIAGIPWMPANLTLEPLESVDIIDYDTVVVIGTLPSAFDGAGESDPVQWLVPDVSEVEFDADRLYAQVREDADELFDRLE